MGYVSKGFDKVGTKLVALVRGRPQEAVVSKMPFVPTQYYRAA